MEREIFFFQKSFRKSGRETSSRPLLFFEKSLFEVKASGLQCFIKQWRNNFTLENKSLKLNVLKWIAILSMQGLT